MSMIEDAILKLDDKLSNSNLRYVFLGGSVLSLLVTDSSAAAIRVTKDVDVMVNVRTRKDFRAAERTLEALGFRHDTREDAPICRWVCDGVTVDVLPIRQEVLGWNSKWFEEARVDARPPKWRRVQRSRSTTWKRIRYINRTRQSASLPVGGGVMPNGTVERPHQGGDRLLWPHQARRRI